MKIKRFALLEKLDPTVFEYIDNFKGSVDDTIMSWIADISRDELTKLSEYKNAVSIKFAESKNLKKVKEYLTLVSEIKKLEKQVDKLKKNKDKLEFEADNEMLYKFQEELLEKDFDAFYELFIKELNDDSDTIKDNIDITETDIHPNIIKKYKDKIEEKLELFIASKKYNL